MERRFQFVGPGPKSRPGNADVLVNVFGSVNARSSALDHVLKSLIRAAITGERDDNEAATDALERVLREGRLL